MSGAGRDAATTHTHAARAQLARRMVAQGRLDPADLPLRPRPAGVDVLPLSFAQEEVWVLSQVDTSGIAFNLAVPPLWLEGRLDIGSLERSLHALVQRHEVLRTTLQLRDGEAAQVVASRGRVNLEVEPLAATPEAQERAVREAMQREMERPFDLARGPLMRARLLVLAPERHALLLTMHHVVFDGVSMGILLGELAAVYAALAQGEPSPLAPLALHYGDFALAQRRRVQTQVDEAALGYWRRQLQDLPELKLPAASAAAQGHGRTLRDAVLLSRSDSDALKVLARREGATPFALMLTLLAALLHRFSGQDDFGIGSAMTTRTRPELEPVIGFFVNMVVLRADFDGRPCFAEMLRRLRDVTLAAMEQGQVPFDQVVRALGAPRKPGRNPLFQVSFAYEADGHGALRFPGLKSRLMRFHAGSDDEVVASAVSRYDLEAYARDEHDCLSLDLSVAERHGRAGLRRLLAAFRALVGGVLADPQRPVAELPLADGAGRAAWLALGQPVPLPLPRDVDVHTLFAEQARRHPDACAVEDGAGRPALSYRQLDERAEALAQRLRRLGAGGGESGGVAVAISMQRGPGLMVGLLGILKAGAAYVPLDTDYPPERISFMLRDSAARLVVTQPSLLGKLPPSVRAVLLDESSGMEDEPAPPGTTGTPDADPPADIAVADPSALAYVIYTSGSTGQPKGVQVEHRAIVRLVRGTDYWQCGEGQRVAQASVVSFDAATFEIWAPLLNGGTVVTVPREVLLGPDDFVAFLAERRIDALFLTTALFNQLAHARPSAFARLQCLLFGGEVCDPAAVRSVLEAGAPQRLLHVYGPTEVTTFATAHLVDQVAGDALTIPIGRPIANTTAYVLDDAGEPVPPGVPGELWLGGVGVARGYLGREDLTARSFVPDRFGTEPEGRLYRTGDHVRRRDDGAIEFMGRRDGQVKVRGFRIELGEIETAMRRLPALRDAVAVVREDAPGDRRVVAYVVPRQGLAVDLATDALRASLKAVLPEHLLPSALVALDALPLNANGKVARSALPSPAAARSASLSAAKPAPAAAVAAAPPAPVAAATPSAPVPPDADGGELAASIAVIWREQLQLPRVGLRDNFFDLGGHSLLLVRTHAKLRDELGLSCKVVDLFAYPTIESLCEFLQRRPGGDAERQAALQRTRRRAAAGAAADPVAIVGIAGRFPGAADVETFWQQLQQGVESIRRFGVDEMRAAGVPETLLADPDHVPARGWLADAELFDAGFFGYSAREAEAIDPQQRLLLECATELFDRAGCDPTRAGVPIGVFAGASQNSYLAHLQSHGPLPESLQGLSRVLASGHDFLATRLAYKLDLCGPALNVQTACSTSLVAVHLACRSLADHDCDIALAGGASVTVPLMAGHVYVDEGIGSRDGHCRPFSADAGGTVGGNGVAMVMLKRLSDALRDGDHVHALIRGSAINNDGARKVGYTAPSVEGQARAIAQAQAAAGLTPDDVQMVEAHGTGTHLGDPIEIAALTRVFGARPRRGEPCWISALKGNIGHLDAAAGVAGLIKTALSIEHGRIAPSLHAERPNPQIDFANSPFAVNTELRDWQPATGVPRRAGVSSFGLGGTNAHAVLEQAPAPPQSQEPSRQPQLLVQSARSATALEQAAATLAAHLRRHPQSVLADVAWTLQTGRREYAHRRAVVARSADEAAALLLAPASAATAAASAPRVVFLFSGQGSQYPGMARGLYDGEPAFREALDECCTQLTAPLGLDLRSLLFPADDKSAEAAAALRRTSVAQPAIFATAYACARWWQSVGVHPAAVLGHSVGELAAACLAGVMPLADALALVAERGRVMEAQPAGAMLSVSLSEAELRERLPEGLDLAALNGPSLCVVSGREEAIGAFEALMAADPAGVVTRRLHTSHAFHSALMDGALEPFRHAVERVPLSAPRLPLLSNLTGDWLTPEQATDPMYWVRLLREPVRFAPALQRLFAEGAAVLLEVGPGNTLAALSRSHPDRPAATPSLASIRHPGEQRDDVTLLLEVTGRLWQANVRPDWARLQGGRRRRRVVLPPTPLERRRYWIDPAPDTPRPVGAGALAPAPRTARPQRAMSVADFFYLPSWARTATPPPRPEAGRFLVVASTGSAGDGVADALVAAGQRVWRAAHQDRQGSTAALQRVAADRFLIDSTRREAYADLLARLDADGTPPSDVLHAAAAEPDLPAGAALERGVHSVLALAQALAERGRPLRLVVLSLEAHDVLGHERPEPESAMAQAVCKVLALEHPGLTARALDIEPDTAPAAVAAELRADVEDPVVAWRGGRRWVQGFQPLASAALPASAEPLRDGGVYLITGGLGAVGLALAGFIAARVRAHLVLVSRRDMPAREQWPTLLAEGGVVAERVKRLNAIEARGSTVWVAPADVADAAALERALVEARRRYRAPVHGVFHAAGAAKHGQALLELDRAGCAEQWRPKLDGVRALAQALQRSGTRPDFVLLHSSLAATMGVAGFVSYVASHLALDAFAAAQRAAGEPWCSVDWDSWMPGEPTAAAPRPEFALSEAEADEAFGRVLQHLGQTRLLVSCGDLAARVRGALGAPGVGAGPAPLAQSSCDEADAPPLPTSPGVHPRPALSTPYAAPVTALQQQLVTLWEETLGIARIGVDDNFFELGGDSVLNIQIAGKARRAGITMSPKMVFQHQSVAALAAQLANEAAAAPAAAPGGPDRRTEPGPVPLTPLQHWFFERGLQRPQHFNLPLLLELKRPVDPARLDAALSQLVARHDALRLRFERQGGQWQQMLHAQSGPTRVETHDFSALDAAAQDAAIVHAGDELQRRLDLGAGPTWRVARFELGSQRRPRLLFVVHHLVIDMISWRILLEDLQSLIETPGTALPPCSTDLRRWGDHLLAAAASPATRGELPYWLAQAGAAPLPRDGGVGDDTVASASQWLEVLDAETTRAVLTELPRRHGTQVGDALLLALTQTLCDWSGADAVALDLEGHGRDALAPGIDSSRTMGWFTTVYPLRIALPEAGAAGARLADVASQRRAVPRDGVGWGLLRHLAPEDALRQRLAALPAPELSFLYLGQFDQAFGGDALLTPVFEPCGDFHDPQGPRAHLLEVTALVSGGCLRVAWSYSRERHHLATVRRLARGFNAVLRTLVAPGALGASVPPAAAPLELDLLADVSPADLAEIARQLAGATAA